MKDAYASLSCLYLSWWSQQRTRPRLMECTGKDLSIQDIICLSEELKTNTITTGLSLDCQEQKARNQMKMKWDFQCRTGNTIESRGCQALSEMLQVNTTLHEISLVAWDNRFHFVMNGSHVLQYQQVPKLMMKEQKHLHKHWLSTPHWTNLPFGVQGKLETVPDIEIKWTAVISSTGNEIGNEGIKALSEALERNTTLTSLSISSLFIQQERSYTEQTITLSGTDMERQWNWWRRSQGIGKNAESQHNSTHTYV